MSLFPAALLRLSLLGLLGQYPETYNAVINYLEDVAPASVVDPLDRSLRTALQSKGTAHDDARHQRSHRLLRDDGRARGGAAGAQRRLRREVRAQLPAPQGGRHRLERGLDDARPGEPRHGLRRWPLREDMFGYIGLGETASEVWSIVRWPGAFVQRRSPSHTSTSPPTSSSEPSTGSRRGRGEGLRARARHVPERPDLRNRGRHPERTQAEGGDPKRLVRAVLAAERGRYAARHDAMTKRGRPPRLRRGDRHRRPLLHGAARATGRAVLHARVVREMYPVP